MKKNIFIIFVILAIAAPGYGAVIRYTDSKGTRHEKIIPNPVLSVPGLQVNREFSHSVEVVKQRVVDHPGWENFLRQKGFMVFSYKMDDNFQGISEQAREVGGLGSWVAGKDVIIRGYREKPYNRKFNNWIELARYQVGLELRYNRERPYYIGDSLPENYVYDGKFDLVGFSMGGLVVRDYITSPYYNNDIEKAVTVATPNLGSNTADYVNAMKFTRDNGVWLGAAFLVLSPFYQVFEPLAFVAIYTWFSSIIEWIFIFDSADLQADAGKDMIPGSTFLKDLNSRKVHEGIKTKNLIAVGLPTYTPLAATIGGIMPFPLDLIYTVAPLDLVHLAKSLFLPGRRFSLWETGDRFNNKSTQEAFGDEKVYFDLSFSNTKIFNIKYSHHIVPNLGGVHQIILKMLEETN